jgi:3-ketosteroid 9alpha-monooxygenase subunit B
MAVEHTAHVDLIQEHDEDTRSLFLALDEPLVFRPGQFVSFLLPVGGERLIRPYSLASDPDEPEYVEILYNLVPNGPGSRYLHGLKLGDAIQFTGPWGTFTLDEVPDAETVFVADRTGIAPIRSMLLCHASHARRPFRLLYGTTLGVYFDELAALPNVRAEMVAPDRLLDETRRRFVEADADRSRHLFVCGVGPLVYALRDLLRGAGYARRAVQYEKW